MKTNSNKYFMELYTMYHKDLSNFCRSLSWDEEQAKELMSETISRAFTGFENIKEKSKFKSYLFSIASNVLKENIRKKANEKKAIYTEFKSNKSSFEAENYTVNQIINLLPEKHAEVFIMFEVSDISLNNIAEILNTNLSTVKTRLSRARQELKSILSKEFTNHITHF